MIDVKDLSNLYRDERLTAEQVSTAAQIAQAEALHRIADALESRGPDSASGRTVEVAPLPVVFNPCFEECKATTAMNYREALRNLVQWAVPTVRILGGDTPFALTCAQKLLEERQ